MSAQPIQTGDLIASKYRVDGIIGEGAMGVVTVAHHLGLDQLVAIKFLLPALANRPSLAERFRREALTAASIRGEHTCRVLDVGVHEDRLPYIVMEYLEGHTLADEIARRGAIPYSEAIGYVLQACEALAEAHARNIIHRDIKPANLFLTANIDGSRILKVLDFGVSKSLAHEGLGHAALTAMTGFVGSPLYSSPEQLLSSKDLDARSDLWSLAVVLYELITGRPAFMADTVAALIDAITNHAPPPFATLGIDVPDGLEPVLGRALSKRREDRQASVAELAADLAPFASEPADATVKRIYRVLAMSSMRRSCVTGEAPLALVHARPRPTPSAGIEANGSMAKRKDPGAAEPSHRRAGRRIALAVLAASLLGLIAYVLSARGGSPPVAHGEPRDASPSLVDSSVPSLPRTSAVAAARTPSALASEPGLDTGRPTSVTFEATEPRWFSAARAEPRIRQEPSDAGGTARPEIATQHDAPPETSGARAPTGSRAPTTSRPAAQADAAITSPKVHVTDFGGRW